LVHCAANRRVSSALQALATQALGTPVALGELTVEANGLVPQVAVHDLRVPGAGGQGGLQVPRAVVAFSVASLLRGGVEQLVIDDADVALARDAQGRWWLGGLDLSAPSAGDMRAADWLFAQEELVLRNARLPGPTPSRARRRWPSSAWTGAAQRPAPPPVRAGRHAAARLGRALHADRPVSPGLAGAPRRALAALDGRLYASLPGVQAAAAAPLAPWLQAQGVGGLRGAAALRLWLDVRRGSPVDARADVALQGASITLAPQLAPLALAELSTRLAWRRQADGFQASTQALRFTLPDGTAWPGGNLSFGHRAAGGTLQADRLDLATLARLAASLPLPPEWGERLRRSRWPDGSSGWTRAGTARCHRPATGGCRPRPRACGWRRWRARRTPGAMPAPASPAWRARRCSWTPGPPAGTPA
jgi:uncharacterized protein YhdP